MIDFILLVFIGISISVFGISYIFEFLDEITEFIKHGTSKSVLDYI